jgi:antitoxin YokJ
MKMGVDELIERISCTSECNVLAASGQPVVRSGEQLPADLERFYSVCGGAELFVTSDYPLRIVRPSELVRANPEIVGVEATEDITDSWYIVARGGSEEAISIDCRLERLGRCYDSFWDRHGVAGSCPVIALSFTELLSRFVAAEGKRLYWLERDWVGYGDAYSGVGS